MRLAFILIIIGGGAFFALTRRRFDLFTLAFFSAVVYFMPGFWGYVLVPAPRGRRVPEELIPEAYAVFILVLGMILVGALIYDRIPTRPPRLRLPRPEAAAYLLTAGALAGMIASIALSGTDLFSPHKQVVLASLTRWHVLWVTAASLGAIIAFSVRRWATFIVCAGVLVFDLYIGFRNNLALAVVAIFVVALVGQGPRRLVLALRLRWWLAVGGASVLFFGYKFLYRPIKRGDWGRVGDLLGEPTFLLDAVQKSEPFMTQAILNKVLTEHFVSPLADLADLFYQLVFFAPELGASTATSRPGYRTLFPDAVGGIGNNVWAEMWARGGWALLVLFVIGFVATLALGSYLLRSPDVLTRSGAALGGAFWAFYIHRNTLAFQVTLEKRILFFWLVACAGALVWAALSRSAARYRADKGTHLGGPAIARELSNSGVEG